VDLHPDVAGQSWGRLANEAGKPGRESSRGPVAPEQEPPSPEHQRLICLELGIALLVLPWTHLWTENNLLLNYPTIRIWAANAFVRGAFSGLGLIDIWLGIWEVVSYRETKVN